MRTRLVLAALPVALIGVVAATPGVAAPKETSKSYTAAASPDPSPNGTGACTRGLPGGEHVEPLKVTTPGKLVVEMTGFQGDWDLCVLDASGKTLGSSTGFIEATKEVVSLKVKKAGEYQIVAQNLMGGPTAAMKYVFTPGR